MRRRSGEWASAHVGLKIPGGVCVGGREQVMGVVLLLVVVVVMKRIQGSIQKEGCCGGSGTVA